MKAITIVNKIIDKGEVSIGQIELLNKALHREGILPESRSVRFKMLFGNFDIVNTGYLHGSDFDAKLCSQCDYSEFELKEYLFGKVAE